MRSKSFSRLGIPLAFVCGLGVTGPAPGAEHDTPLAATKNRVYPSGANISQKYERPEANAATLVETTAAGGGVSHAAAMHNLLIQPKTRARVQAQLTPVFRSQTRIRLSGGAVPMGVAAVAAGEAPSLHKFTYGYQYKDVPLWKYSTQSQIIQVRNGSRKTLLLRERNAPNADLLGETDATVSTEDAARVGVADSRDAAGAALALDNQNETPHREIHVDAGGRPTLSWAFVVRSNDRKQPFARRYWVAARGEPRILAKEDLIYHQAPAGATAQQRQVAGNTQAPAGATAEQGRVTGTIFGFKQSPFDPPAKGQGLNDFTAAVFGGQLVNTDANGFFSVQIGETLNNRLAGPFCRVINEAGSPLLGTTAGNTVVFNAVGEEEIAQVSAFKWVSTAHHFVADFVVNNDDRLRNLPTHVNIDDTCNAFFDPNTRTLNFFKSGGDCANSAYCDVACHEFGHAVDDQFGEILDGGYSEGFGDSLAILITQDSVIGRDFFGKGKPPLRNAKEIHTWPPVNPEVHEVGKIYGGFTWELTQQLTSKLGDTNKAFEAARQLVLGAAALNPQDTPDAVRLSFLVDRQNGSPFFKELAAAADSRKIPRPESPGDLDDPTALTGGNSR
jgi:hypothetical protein